MLEWWGYIHKSGTKHVKIYFGPEDIEEAKESPFVAVACGPWACSGREEALKLLEEESK